MFGEAWALLGRVSANGEVEDDTKGFSSYSTLDY